VDSLSTQFLTSRLLRGRGERRHSHLTQTHHTPPLANPPPPTQTEVPRVSDWRMREFARSASIFPFVADFEYSDSLSHLPTVSFFASSRILRIISTSRLRRAKVSFRREFFFSSIDPMAITVCGRCFTPSPFRPMTFSLP